MAQEWTQQQEARLTARGQDRRHRQTNREVRISIDISVLPCTRTVTAVYINHATVRVKTTSSVRRKQNRKNWQNA